MALVMVMDYYQGTGLSGHAMRCVCVCVCVCCGVLVFFFFLSWRKSIHSSIHVCVVEGREMKMETEKGGVRLGGVGCISIRSTLYTTLPTLC